MPRLKVAIPAEALLIYQTQIPVMISHVNYGNHLGHDSLISILHEARLQFIKQRGIMDEISIEPKVSLIVGSLAATYFHEAFYGELLTIEIFASGITKKTCDFFYKVTRAHFNQSEKKETLIATASTFLFFINTENRKPVAIPKTFRDALALSSNF